MQLDLSGAIEQIQRMANAFLQRLPYIVVILGLLVALVIALPTFRPGAPDVLDTQDKVLLAVKKTLGAHGIDLPFETRMVLFHGQTEETDGDRGRQREGWPAGEGESPRPDRLAVAVRERPRARGGPEGGTRSPEGS